MQETGSNSSETTKILSVRLSANGLSFSVVSPKGLHREDFVPFRANDHSIGSAVRNILESRRLEAKDYRAVQVFLDTPDTAYVPAEALERAPASYFLTQAGIYPSGGDKVVCTSAVDGLCGVMVFDGMAVKFLEEYFPEKISYFSPLQETLSRREAIPADKGGVVVNITGENIYVAVLDAAGKLQVAEVYPYTSQADILFCLQKLSEGTANPKPRIYIYGSRASQYYKVIKKYFKGARCIK